MRLIAYSLFAAAVVTGMQPAYAGGYFDAGIPDRAPCSLRVGSADACTDPMKDIGKLLFGPPSRPYYPVDPEERRHREMMDQLERIEDAVRAR